MKTLSLTPRRQIGRRHSFSDSVWKGSSRENAPENESPTSSIHGSDTSTRIVDTTKHSIRENQNEIQLLQAENERQAQEIKLLVIENQRLIRKVEDADRHTQTVEDQLRTEIKFLQEKRNEKQVFDDLTTITANSSDIETLTHLFIQGSIESVPTSSITDGNHRLVVSGRITEVENESSESPGNVQSDEENEAFNLEEEFAQVCAQNEDLRKQINDLQNQLGRLMKAQVDSLTEELELVQAESQSLRNQTFSLDPLPEENIFLRHRILALDPHTEELHKRGTQLISILEGLDNLSDHSDDPTAFGSFAEDMSEGLMEIEKHCVPLEDCNDLMSDCQAENEKLRNELTALRARREAVLSNPEGTELEEEVSRLMTMKDNVADSLEKQVDYLQSTCEAISNERDELQIRVREQAKLIQAFERLLDNGEIGDQTIVSVVGDCLQIVKTSQLESTRTYEELRLLHRQIHVIEEENVDLKQEISRLKRQIQFNH
jgi:predicted  nucleic acid-binding Zn-ribbon protein